MSGDDRTAPSNKPMKNAGRLTKEEAAFVYSRLGVEREMIGHVFLFLRKNEAGGQLSHLVFSLSREKAPKIDLRKVIIMLRWMAVWQPSSYC